RGVCKAWSQSLLENTNSHLQWTPFIQVLPLSQIHSISLLHMLTLQDQLPKLFTASLCSSITPLFTDKLKDASDEGEKKHKHLLSLALAIYYSFTEAT
ncbi:MAG: hypothetical protein ACXV2C_01165, partial [Candidatus Bathyarchaeia archaeon]